MQPLAQEPIRINRRTALVLMAAHGVTRTEIARLAGVHLWTVTRVLKNFRRVAPDKRMAVLRAIASRCGCEIEELVMGRLAA